MKKRGRIYFRPLFSLKYRIDPIYPRIRIGYSKDYECDSAINDNIKCCGLYQPPKNGV